MDRNQLSATPRYQYLNCRLCRSQDPETGQWYRWILGPEPRRSEVRSSVTLLFRGRGFARSPAARRSMSSVMSSTLFCLIPCPARSTSCMTPSRSLARWRRTTSGRRFWPDSGSRSRWRGPSSGRGTGGLRRRSRASCYRGGRIAQGLNFRQISNSLRVDCLLSKTAGWSKPQSFPLVCISTCEFVRAATERISAKVWRGG